MRDQITITSSTNIINSKIDQITSTTKKINSEIDQVTSLSIPLSSMSIGTDKDHWQLLACLTVLSALTLLVTLVEYLWITDHHWPETIGITLLKKAAVFARNGISDKLPDLSWYLHTDSPTQFGFDYYCVFHHQEGN
ncbi:hypothetical protein PIROE2DRAFT_9703 [Piromyces sp. E2]|nr:hypothetical protein PIROE2DRAFT_9703 [Piromyces sp. E2]|eukprot:OUM63693.1 hypothetical protein PIROE2DRAFT_9703 [Piromyces sp. E2]